jgi:hypothetical protein
MAIAMTAQQDALFLPTIGDLGVGESGYVPADALVITEERALFLDTDAPVMSEEDPWAPLFVIRTPTGFLVDAAHAHGQSAARRGTRPPLRAPVIAVMHGDDLLR